MPRLQHEYFHQKQKTLESGWELVKSRPLKDRNLLPGLEMQVIVDGEEHHEVQEEGSCREEMPNVVVVIEVEQLTLKVERNNINSRVETFTTKAENI